MMLLSRKSFVLTCASRQLINTRSLSDKKLPFSENVSEVKRQEHPASRTARIIKNDFKRVGNWMQDKMDYFRKLSPKQKRYSAPIEAIDNFIQNREDVTLFQVRKVAIQ
jgi:peptidoglycan hydrolase CwlO-like protein